MQVRILEIEVYSGMALCFFYSVRLYIDPDVYYMRQYTMYIYHIKKFDNKQDATFFVSIIEAI